MKNNIILFRGKNTILLREKLHAWREKFIEKHGEMNLIEIRKENIFPEILQDTLAPGFMGTSRMIVFHDHLLKTPREIEEKEEGMSTEIALEGKETTGLENDGLWIQTLTQIPETNFVIFIGNDKPVTELEKWLEDTARKEEFHYPSIPEIEDYIISNLHVTHRQAQAFRETLGFSEEFKWGKNIVIGKPDYIYREVEKLKLLEKTSWTDEELANNIADYREEIALDLMDTLWKKDSSALTSQWRRLLETADHELSMASIITMVRKTLVLTTFPNLADIPPISNFHRNTAKRLGKEQISIKKLYEGLVSIDIAEKSGELPHKDHAFFMTLLEFCT